ncbi:MAG TPA: hypothetical protein PK006_03920 [Saprospiraceae bacterium]|nr:hypothetical protein [Saprospiraceae bacterium]
MLIQANKSENKICKPKPDSNGGVYAAMDSRTHNPKMDEIGSS